MTEKRGYRALSAHAAAHGLLALAATIESAWSIVSTADPLSINDHADLQQHLDRARDETRSLLFSAITLLWHEMPEVAAGLARPNFVATNLPDLLRSVLPQYVALAESRGIQIEHVHDDQSELVPLIVVETNTIRRVFHNILMNAIKYSYAATDDTARTVKIWWKRHDSHGDRWVLRVQNYGIGVEPHERSTVFEPGYRGERARAENTYGTGLGLADVRFAMRLHGGTAYLRSDRKHGDTFVTTVSLVFPVDSRVKRRFNDRKFTVGR